MEIKCDVVLSDKAIDNMKTLAKSDHRSSVKVFSMIEEIVRIRKNGDNPLSGTGKPEYLKGNMNGYMSRRINDKDRLVYYFTDNSLVIASCIGHYEDK